MEQIKSTMIAVCNQPVMETHSAIFLEIFVIPAAAVLSFSLTTATIYDCLVGTSICERAILAKYNAIVNGSVGANATSIIKILLYLSDLFYLQVLQLRETKKQS